MDIERGTELLLHPGKKQVLRKNKPHASTRSIFGLSRSNSGKVCHPLAADKESKTWMYKAAVVFNLLWPLLFLGLGISMLGLNGKSESRFGNTITTLMSIAPTLWPVCFASVVGGTSKAIAKWMACNNRPQPDIRLFLGSQTVLETISTTIAIGRLSWYLLPLLALWTFSPIGSQASLRSIYLKENFQTYTLAEPIRYANSSFVQEWKTAANTQKPYGNDWSPIGVTMTIWLASLLSREAGLQCDSSTPATEAQNFLFGADRWGNVRIPKIELLKDYDQNNHDWIDVDYNLGTVDYNSLIGVPVQVPNVTNAEVSFVISANYHSFKCSDWHIMSSDVYDDEWMAMNYPNMRYTYSPDLNKAPWSGALRNLSGSIGPLNTFSFDVDNTSSLLGLELYANSSSKPKNSNQYLGFPIQNHSTYFAGWQFTKCATHLTYVDANVTYNFTDGVPGTPFVTKMKLTESPTSSLNITPYEIDGINLSMRSSMTQQLAYQEIGNITIRSMLQNFLADPYAFSISEARQINLDKVPITSFEKRLGLISNTLWRAFAYPMFITNPHTQTTYPDTQMSISTAQVLSPAAKTYTLNTVWIILYFVASILMLLMTVTGFFMKRKTRGQEVPETLTDAMRFMLK